ncbi:MAG TPA: tRNA 2-thiouridine(34) synthase MnmA [Phycisphaerales bacterium]|nr:tRNA 2-thiouridine(34) synthase MnmA [Phycisphaerales bacterium]
MSGGVDSSVAAALLVREGYEVVGCFMRLGSPGESLDRPGPPDGGSCAAGSARIGHQGCCSINDAADARLVAGELGIAFYVCNFKRDFGRIIDYFVDEYASGRTPNPCVRCNDWLKFGKLHYYAQQIGADFVASGHYARVEKSNHGATESRRGQDGSEYRLMRGVDHSKDQSYVLFGVPREQLAHTLLPIGGFQKPAVRDLAQQFGLPVFDKPDSQEICFVPDNDYAGLVESRAPGAAREGAVLDEGGAVVGSHGGQHRFTIGQRRGVSVSLGYPVYVVAKDPARNTITVGPRERLMTAGCTAGEANWLVPDDWWRGRSAREPSGWTPVLARHRYNGAASPARARRLGDSDSPTPSGRTGRFEVSFDEPQQAVTPGQAIVLYDALEPDVVLGGGWIEGAVSPTA